MTPTHSTHHEALTEPHHELQAGVYVIQRPAKRRGDLRADGQVVGEEGLVEPHVHLDFALVFVVGGWVVGWVGWVGRSGKWYLRTYVVHGLERGLAGWEGPGRRLLLVLLLLRRRQLDVRVMVGMVRGGGEVGVCVFLEGGTQLLDGGGPSLWS